MTFDAKDRYVVLFGGIDDSGAFQRAALGDTWMFAGGTWTELYPYPSPPPRFAAALAYDVADAYVVLFGGAPADVWIDTGASSLNDSWAFSGGHWTLLHPQVAPPAEWGAGMAYDTHDRYIVLFGGFPDTSGGFETGWPASSATWSFVQGEWQEVNFLLTPPARGLAAMTWDSVDGYVMLFGGCADGIGCFTPLNDTWAYLSGSWTQVDSLKSPSVRGMAGISDDESDHYVLLFGGGAYDGLPNGDTWTYAHGEWRLHPTTQPPDPRYAASMAFDPSSGRTLLLDGCSFINTGCPTNMGENAGNALGDQWTYLAGDWSPFHSVHEPPTGYFPECGTVILIGYAASMVYDPVDHYVLYFGGPSDTWKYAAGQWTQLTPYASPPSQFYTAMTFDAEAGYVLLFGGYQCGSAIGSTWKFSHGQWTDISVGSAPSPRAGAMMTFDAKEGYVILFGGCYASGCLGDTWEFARGLWHQVTTSVQSPSARGSGAMSYDPAGGFVLLFGGADQLTCIYCGISDIFNDTWTFSAGQWTQSYLPVSPPGRTEAGMAYDGPGVAGGAASGGMILFGGSSLNETFSGASYSSDTWEFAAGKWIMLSVPLAPPARDDAAMAYDPLSRSILMVGGESFWTQADSGSGGGNIIPLPDTWQLSFPTAHLVIFSESGLPKGSTWGVTVDGISRHSIAPRIEFLVPNGTNLFAVSPEAGYVSDPSAGTLMLGSNGVEEHVTFAAIVPLRGPHVIGVGADPRALAVDSTNGRIYVANAASNDISVIDGATQKVVGTIHLGQSPLALAFDSANGFLYAADGNQIAVINGVTDQVFGSISLQSPYRLTYDPANGFLYALFFDISISTDPVLAVIDPATGVILAVLTDFSQDPDAIAVDTLNGYLYVPDDYSGVTIVIDPATNLVVGYFGNQSDCVASIAFDRQNGYLYEADPCNFGVPVIDGSTNTVLGVIGLGLTASPFAVAYDDQNGQVFVTNETNYVSGPEYVTAINGTTDSISASLRLGNVLSLAIAFDDENGYLYIANSNSTVTVVPPSSV